MLASSRCLQFESFPISCKYFYYPNCSSVAINFVASDSSIRNMNGLRLVKKIQKMESSNLLFSQRKEFHSRYIIGAVAFSPGVSTFDFFVQVTISDGDNDYLKSYWRWPCPGGKRPACDRFGLWLANRRSSGGPQPRIPAELSGSGRQLLLLIVTCW